MTLHFRWMCTINKSSLLNWHALLEVQMLIVSFIILAAKNLGIFFGHLISLCTLGAPLPPYVPPVTGSAWNDPPAVTGTKKVNGISCYVCFTFKMPTCNLFRELFYFHKLSWVSSNFYLNNSIQNFPMVLLRKHINIFWDRNWIYLNLQT